jgi:heme oxygenase
MPASNLLRTLLEDLRARTAEAHRALEAGPYACALSTGTLTLASYRAFLQAMATLHGALEGALATSPLAPLRGLARPERLTQLQRDLQHLQGGANVESPRAALQAEVAAAKLRVGTSLEPRALLGWVYVWEGAALGNLVQRTAIAERFGLEGEGLAFLGGAGQTTRARFESAVDAIASIDAQGAAREAALAAAEEAFTQFARILEALVPLDATPLHALVSVLNSEAGRHPVADDLLAIAAAFRAGERTWQENPYYAIRYGERGIRFTRSDSAWLAALAGSEVDHVVAQVAWLAGVLAARGMPSLLLEQHLRTLHGELEAIVPPHRHQPLLEAARTLHASRARYLADADVEALEASFEERVDAADRLRLPRMGRLLAAAVADQAAGRAHAVSSLVDWLSEPARFAPTWVSAVQETLAQARTKL